MDKLIENEIILENLSFYEWMNLENLLISINPQDLVLVESLSLDELKQVLKRLVKQGHVQTMQIDGEDQYKRVLKKSLKSKVLNFLK